MTVLLLWLMEEVDSTRGKLLLISCCYFLYTLVGWNNIWYTQIVFLIQFNRPELLNYYNVQVLKEPQSRNSIVKKVHLSPLEGKGHTALSDLILKLSLQKEPLCSVWNKISLTNQSTHIHGVTLDQTVTLPWK